jgi:EAL domain-containing protein (putative c-di-GMP-specific phosphodiesterase class I)
VRILKIDRSFLDSVRSSNNAPCILKGMVALARELNLTVIMEGVETRAHLDYVRAAGCNIVQGFYLARPMPAGEIQSQLRRTG